MIDVFDDLAEALAAADHCRELELIVAPDSELPTTLIVLTKLESLRLIVAGDRRGQARFQLPAWIGRLRGLRVLEVEGELDGVPESLGELDTLERLQLRTRGPFPDSIARLKCLRELDLQVTTLESVPLALRDLDRLEMVRLHVGRLAALPLGLLALPNVRTLVLEVDNAVEASHEPLPPLLPGLQRLEDLAVLGWQISRLPSSIFAIRQLRSLTLRRCGLRVLPEGWGAFGWLRKLDLSENSLESLPSSLGELAELRELVLTHNPLRTLPPELGRLARLERLDLDGSRLSTLPPELADAQRLQVLHLADTRSLLELPISFARLGELTTLDLARGALREVPEWLGALPRLESLRLDGNQIRSVPDSLFGSPSLEQLALRNNPLDADLRDLLEEMRIARALAGYPLDLVW
jgi:Leucine-rich repeat (LRR) protein